jgi:hypothetical protein
MMKYTLCIHDSLTIHAYISVWNVICCIICLQTQDFGCALKMNHQEDMMYFTWMMFKVCIMLGKQLYARAIYTNFQILYYHKMQDSDIWKLMTQHIQALNEESGEISFGILSRCVIGDTTKMKFNHLSKTYSTIGLYAEINQDLADDIKAPLIKRTKRHIRADSPEVIAVGAYFSAKIRELKSNNFWTYHGPITKKQKANVDTRKVTRNEPVPTYWKDDITAETTEISDYCYNHVRSYFLKDFRDIWPEGQPEVSPVKVSDVKMNPEDLIQPSDIVIRRDVLLSPGSARRVSDVMEEKSIIHQEVVISDNKEVSDIPDEPGEIEDDDDAQEHSDLDADDDGYRTPPRGMPHTFHQQFMEEVRRITPRKRRRRLAAENGFAPMVSP